MIDIHTHILPEIDDGAKSVEESVKMLEIALAQGVKTIVFTPHYYGKYSVKEFIEKRQESFEKIKGYIPKGIQVYLGAEVYFDGVNLLHLEELSALTIGNTRYILLELPFIEKWTSALMQKIGRLIEETDCIPILAHIERYEEVRREPALVSSFVKMGCLIQVNAHSFMDKKDKNFVYTLLKKGLAHCLGSDTHDVEKRLSDYHLAIASIEKAGYINQLKKIQNNMERILSSEDCLIKGTKKVKKIFGFYY